ncbi:NAD(P)-binding protein [Deinococcus carri]|uniref:NAD(P)-binding protein n=1 Tax=Deinococcus carri TaxID=1211323 RepID=UPI0031E82E5E
MPRPAGAPASGVAVKSDIVVIGAGQAGLSSAYHLKKRGIAPGRGFVMLDQSPEPGGAWQFRWPTLTLSTVNCGHDLSGMRFSEAVDMGAAQVQARVAVPQYFAAYEKAFGLPVYRPVRMTVVSGRGEHLRSKRTGATCRPAEASTPQEHGKARGRSRRGPISGQATAHQG